MSGLIEKIQDAGIVGLGGAGFPTHVKLNARFKNLIVNAAECEPLLRTDRYVMRAFPREIVTAIAALKEECRAETATIALKDGYKEEINALQNAIKETGVPVSLCLLRSFYPAGDEQIIVAEVTKNIVPPAGIPLDVGAVVINVQTAYNVFRAMNGEPLTHKYVTVTGAVKSPTVVRAPIGTAFTALIDAVGGTLTDEYVILSGGPMMGRRIKKENLKDEFVTKTTSGIIVIPLGTRIANTAFSTLESLRNRAKCSCIQCSFCTDLCPRHLLGHPIEPHKIMRRIASVQNTEELLVYPEIKNAALCSECGLCEMYSCPMGLSPRTVNSFIKKKLQETGIRYEKGAGQENPSDRRNERFLPTKRVAMRAGVERYYDVCSADRAEEYHAKSVRVFLKQHIGAPSVPIVRDGDRVNEGELIAKAADGKLGANIHASVTGTVRVFADRIEITE